MRLRRAWGVPLGDSDGPPSPKVEGPTQPLLPIAASCVPTVGRNRELFLVPAHYRPTMDGPEPTSIRLVTALDREGREVRLHAYETEVTADARRFLEGARLDAPRYEYCPVRIPEEAWAAYERLVPDEWMPSASSPEVFAVRGAMSRSLVATIPVVGGEAMVPLAPRVARDPRPGRRDPLFRLALRDVVHIQTSDAALKEAEQGGNAGEVRP